MLKAFHIVVTPQAALGKNLDRLTQSISEWWGSGQNAEVWGLKYI